MVGTKTFFSAKLIKTMGKHKLIISTTSKLATLKTLRGKKKIIMIQVPDDTSNRNITNGFVSEMIHVTQEEWEQSDFVGHSITIFVPDRKFACAFSNIAPSYNCVVNVIKAHKLSTTLDGTFDKNTVNIIYGKVADWTKCMHFNEIYMVYVLFLRKVSDVVKHKFIAQLVQFEFFCTYAVIDNVDGALIDDTEKKKEDYELNNFYSQLQLRNLCNKFGKKIC